MRKILLLAFVAIAAMVTSCKKDENVSIEGTWQLESIIKNEENQTLEECEKMNTYEFTSTDFVKKEYFVEEQTGDCVKDDYLENGTYSIEGKNIKFTTNNNSYSIPFSLSGNKLTLDFLEKNNTIKVYKRVN